MKATRLWSIWQAMLLSFAVGFKQRFVEWLTGLALNVEEHAIAQSLIGLGRVGDWMALEFFAEYGVWNLPFMQMALAWRLDRLPNRCWHGYLV